MSKLIVEMEMPRACRWYEDGTTKLCPITEWGGGGTACSITKLFEPFDDKRPSWCPIKGVLPDEHGDLIDRSLLCADLIGVILSHSGLGVSEVIARQDAVIAAERKDDKKEE